MPRLFEEFGLYNQLQGYYFVGFFLVTFDLNIKTWISEPVKGFIVVFNL